MDNHGQTADQARKEEHIAKTDNLGTASGLSEVACLLEGLQQGAITAA